MHADSSVSIEIVSENFEKDGIRVIFEWTQENHTLYSYNVSVTPHPAATLTSERKKIELKVSYDLLYNQWHSYNRAYQGTRPGKICLCPGKASQQLGNEHNFGYYYNTK